MGVCSTGKCWTSKSSEIISDAIWSNKVPAIAHCTVTTTLLQSNKMDIAIVSYEYSFEQYCVNEIFQNMEEMCMIHIAERTAL